MPLRQDEYHAELLESLLAEEVEFYGYQKHAISKNRFFNKIRIGY